MNYILNDNSVKTDKKTRTEVANRATVPQKRSRGAISKTLALYFPPTSAPLKKPIIDDDLEDLPILERVTESLKYNIQSIEYSISPRGGLRQYLKFNISVFLLIGIPLFLFLPLFSYFMNSIAHISASFAAISEFLDIATQSLFNSSINILKTIGVLIAISTILYLIFRFLRYRL